MNLINVHIFMLPTPAGFGAHARTYLAASPGTEYAMELGLELPFLAGLSELVVRSL